MNDFIHSRGEKGGDPSRSGLDVFEVLETK